MSINAQTIVDFISAHAGWTAVLIFLVSFGESFAFISFFFPGTTIMIAAGTLIPSGMIPLWPLLIGAIAGATLGDFISYWIGHRFGPVLENHWPFARHPQLLAMGRAFFDKYGEASVFIGRFFGPVRAVVPLVAGTLRMPVYRFTVANIASALIWAPALLFAGWLTATTIGTLRLGRELELLAAIGIIVVAALGLAVAKRYRARRDARK
jgi:membrane protein DedA with SNARE-associated domain